MTGTVTAESREWDPRPVFAVLAIAVASRVLVFLSGRFGMRHLPFDRTTLLVNFDMPPWFQWDAVRYLEVATRGYPTQASGFFPLYPLLGNVIHRITGLPITWALLGVSNACFIAAALLLFDLARREFDDETALIAVASLAFFPSTVFLSAPYSESLFVLLSVITFRCLSARQLWWAALVAGLAAASRPFGCALAPAVAIEAYRMAPAGGYGRWTRALAALIVSVWGLLLYAGYLQVMLGISLVRDYVEWPAGHVGGLRANLPWTTFAHIITSDMREPLVNVVFFIGLIAMTTLAFRVLALRYAVFCAVVVIAEFYIGPRLLFLGANRHVLALVPVHFLVAMLFRRHFEYALAAFGLSAGVSVFWTALYVQGYQIR